MSRRVLCLFEVIIVLGLVLLTRCANHRDVFAGGQVYFVDADCYARMTRARICFEHPGIIIRRHDFENFPAGTSPHTTAPLDYLIVALAALLTPFTQNALELAGAIVSPLIAVALGIFLCWWTRRIRMQFRFALLGLYAVSPILAHGTALGRPDHQSLLIALIGVALCAEWMLWREPVRSWAIVCGTCWALAIWVSLYEPLVVLALVLLARALFQLVKPPALVFDGVARTKWIVFGAVLVCAIIIERRLPAWPTRETFTALQSWSGSIGELGHVPWHSHIWFEWCSWLLVLAPILLWRKRAGRCLPGFLVVLLAATFALTIAQARWSYFFTLVFILLVPDILAAFRNRVAAWCLFAIALFPVAQAWDRIVSEQELGARVDTRLEQNELRALASPIDSPFLAPWWFSPALSYWSNRPAAAGSSHESINGIVDCARFYATSEPTAAAAICTRREMGWVVSYDAERLAANCARVLDSPVPPSALCYVLDRSPSHAPPFLHLEMQTARFKLYRVAKNWENSAQYKGTD